MGVSIVIPCYNEEKYISSCIQSFIENGFPFSELEILVVDGGSKDRTLPIIKDFTQKNPFIQLLENKRKKTPFALNIGVEQAKFEFILIAGAHAYYPHGYIRTLHNQLKNSNMDVIGGSIETTIKNENSKSRAIKLALSHRFGVGNSVFRVGAKILQKVDTVPFGLYKKEIFEKVGLYNEALIRNHDIELSKRIIQAGYSIWLNPELKVKYYARETFSSLAKNQWGNGKWIVKTFYITKRLSALSIRHYIPLLFVLSLILPLLASLIISEKFIYVSIFSLLCYLISILAISITNRRSANIFYLLWTFITIHFSYGFGSLIGFFSFKKLNK